MSLISWLRKFRFKLGIKIIFYLYYFLFLFLLVEQETNTEEHKEVVHTSLFVLFLFIPIRILWEMFTEQISFTQFLINVKSKIVEVKKLITIQNLIHGVEKITHFTFTTFGGILFLCLGIGVLGIILYGSYFVIGGVIGLLNFGWKQL